MKLSEDYSGGAYVIRAYETGSITVNNDDFTQSLLIANHQLNSNWNVQHVEEISHQHWEDILQLQPEVILIGTGEHLIFPHPASYAPVIQQGIGIEFMDSMAACRTYNILLAEDRAVVAGIIL